MASGAAYQISRYLLAVRWLEPKPNPIQNIVHTPDYQKDKVVKGDRCFR